MNAKKIFVHDLKNDLNIIKYLVLKSGLENTTTESIHKIIGSIANKSAIFLEEKEIKNELISIGQTLDEVLNRFPQIAFERNYLSELYLCINKTIFQDAVTNLIINAIEAGADKVNVVVNIDSIVFYDNGNCTDEITAQLNESIFFTTKPHGNGLGSQSVKKFCEMHNFKIHYEILQPTTDLDSKKSLKTTIKI